MGSRDFGIVPVPKLFAFGVLNVPANKGLLFLISLQVIRGKGARMMDDSHYRQRGPAERILGVNTRVRVEALPEAGAGGRGCLATDMEANPWTRHLKLIPFPLFAMNVTFGLSACEFTFGGVMCQGPNGVGDMGPSQKLNFDQIQNVRSLKSGTGRGDLPAYASILKRDRLVWHQFPLEAGSHPLRTGHRVLKAIWRRAVTTTTFWGPCLP